MRHWLHRYWLVKEKKGYYFSPGKSCTERAILFSIRFPLTNPMRKEWGIRVAIIVSQPPARTLCNSLKKYFILWVFSLTMCGRSTCLVLLECWSQSETSLGFCIPPQSSLITSLLTTSKRGLFLLQVKRVY